jgi:hypothetical protein
MNKILDNQEESSHRGVTGRKSIVNQLGGTGLLKNTRKERSNRVGIETVCTPSS